MLQSYRWGDVAPPAVQAMRQRRRWLMNSPGFKNWRAAPASVEELSHAVERAMVRALRSNAVARLSDLE